MIISINTEKLSDQIRHPLIILKKKTVNKVDIQVPKHNKGYI